MLIDWFTVGAQVVNFLILVWLMRRFLYRPILDAINAREKRIASELAAAAEKMAAAEKSRADFRLKTEEFDRQRAGLLAAASDEAKAEGRRLLDTARQTADTLAAKRKEMLVNDARTLNDAIARRTREEVFAIARKVLSELAATSLEARMVEVFVRRLRELDGTVKATLGAALRAAREPAVVRGAFDLPPGERAAIQAAVAETFGADIRIRYEVAPGLVAGVELGANGQKVAWSIADYLTSLEQNVTEAFQPSAAGAGGGVGAAVANLGISA